MSGKVDHGGYPYKRSPNLTLKILKIIKMQVKIFSAGTKMV